MIFADKLTYLRKKHSMTQEDLAIKMEVSRQSVSKWEAAMAMPDIKKIIKLSEIFGVSTDFLLNEDLQIEDLSKELSSETKDELFKGRKIEMDWAKSYLKDSVKFAKTIALAVFIFVSAVASFYYIDSYNNENLESISLIVFFILVALGVGLCIWAVMMMGQYDLIDKEYYELSYGVSGLVEKEEKFYEEKHRSFIISGVILLIISVLPIFVGEYLYRESMNDSIMAKMVTILLIFVAIGSGLLTYTFLRKGSYRNILENEDRLVLDNKKKLGKVFGIYWMTVLTIYLAYSFITNDWGRSWIMWPVAGVLSIIVGIIFDKN